MSLSFHENCKVVRFRLNEAVKSFGFNVIFGPVYSKDWHRLFVTSSHIPGHEVQVGRLTLHNVGGEAEIYTIKPYKPFGYSFNFYSNIVWPLICYTLSGLTITVDELEYAMVEAYRENNAWLKQAVEWRRDHPIKRRRKALTGRHIGTVFSRILFR